MRKLGFTVFFSVFVLKLMGQSYQPLEDQRLSTTHTVDFSTVSAKGPNGLLRMRSGVTATYNGFDSFNSALNAYNGLIFYSTGGTFYNPTTQQFAEIVGGDLKSTGNLGIGTFNPTSAIHIEKSGFISLKMVSTNNPSAYHSEINNDYDAAHAFQIKNGGLNILNATLGGYTKIEVGNSTSQQIDLLAGKVTMPNAVGIGTAAPSENLSVYGTVNAQPGVIALETSRNDASDVTVGEIKAKNSGVEIARIGLLRGQGTYNGFLNFMVKENNNSALYEAMRIVPNGNVGIGTTVPQERLSVNGKIRAQEIKVEATGWPDYVFKDDYKNTPIAELEQFIKIHKHLPDVPTAKSVTANGIELGEMNKILLQKIEELTLHLIDKDKELSAVSQELKDQKGKLLHLESALNKLISQK